MNSLRQTVIQGILLILVLSGCSCFEYCYKDRTWLKFGENCYSFESQSGEKSLMSFYDAEDYCRKKGAHLVSIHSKEENDFIIEATSKNYYGGRQWIGLNNLTGWTDDSHLDYTNVVKKEEYFKENCFVFFKAKGAWRKEHCELRHTPICKRSVHDVDPKPLPPFTPHVPAGNCPDDWLQFGQKCYKYFGVEESERKMFKEAKLACIGLGEDHDLVSIHSQAEQAFMTQHLYYLGAPAWIGFSQIGSDEIGHELVFGWTDNSRVNYTNWAPGYPQRGTWKNCAALSFKGVGKGEWIADYCAIDKKGYICQRPPVADLPPQPSKPSNCGSGAVQYRNACYQFYPDYKNWDDANSTCKASGSYLVSVTDSFEQAFLYNYIKKQPVWIGLRSLKDTAFFEWTDRQPIYYANWFSGQPIIPHLDVSSCVYMSGSGLEWNVTSCSAKLPFVCKSTDDVPPDHPTKVVGNCPPTESSWIDIGDRYCYHVNEDKQARLTWGELSRYCLTRGMDMVTFHSSHEVKSLIPYLWKKAYSFWLGLIRSSDRKSFIWADHSPMNYTNWNDREPSSWSSDKDCAGFSTRDSKWSVTGCSEWLGTICKAKKHF